jgi:hypothetical protein
MGRSKKASRRSAFAPLLVVWALVLWGLREQGEPGEFALAVVLGVWVVLILVAVWLPTTCDVVTKRGGACDDDAYGMLRACHRSSHKRDKRRALLEMLGFHRLARRRRRQWRAPVEPTIERPERTVGRPAPRPAAGSTAPVRVELARSALDRAVMVATIVGAVPAAIQTGAWVT